MLQEALVVFIFKSSGIVLQSVFSTTPLPATTAECYRCPREQRGWSIGDGKASLHPALKGGPQKSVQGPFAELQVFPYNYDRQQLDPARSSSIQLAYVYVPLQFTGTDSRDRFFHCWPRHPLDRGGDTPRTEFSDTRAPGQKARTSLWPIEGQKLLQIVSFFIPSGLAAARARRGVVGRDSWQNNRRLKREISSESSGRSKDLQCNEPKGFLPWPFSGL